MPAGSVYKRKGTLHIESPCPSDRACSPVLPAPNERPLGRANPTTPLHPCTTRPILYGLPDTLSDFEAITRAKIIDRRETLKLNPSDY